MRSLCSVFSSVKVVACQPTPQRVPGKEFVRAERERESFYTLSLSPYLLIVSVDLSDGFSKNEMMMTREDGHTLPTTSKIEKKKKHVPAPPFFLFHSSIYHILNPRLVVYHNFSPTESEK